MFGKNKVPDTVYEECGHKVGKCFCHWRNNPVSVTYLGARPATCERNKFQNTTSPVIESTGQMIDRIRKNIESQIKELELSKSREALKAHLDEVYGPVGKRSILRLPESNPDLRKLEEQLDKIIELLKKDN